jgi:anti-anti-sigma factor
MLPTTQPLLDITVWRLPAASHILVAGELDTATGGELVAAAASVAAAEPVHVDIDLSGVTFTDTAGWRAVQAACRQVTDTGGTASVMAMSPAVAYLVTKRELALAVSRDQPAPGT